MRQSIAQGNNEPSSLNPYSTGRYSVRESEKPIFCIVPSLNPYSTGRYSVSTDSNDKEYKSSLS